MAEGILSEKQEKRLLLPNDPVNTFFHSGGKRFAKST
jgi:hypothetical protein